MKRLLVFFCISLILAAAAPAQPVKEKYTVIPEAPSPGEPVTIGINFYAKQAVLVVDGKRVAKAALFNVPGKTKKTTFSAAVFTIPSTVEGTSAIILLENDKGSNREIPLTITPREFNSEKIVLSNTMASLINDPDPQKVKEAERLWAILNFTGSEIYHSGKFSPPVTSTRRTSAFGSRRVNQYPSGRTTTSIHAGVDYGVPKGTEVFACGAGKVVLACMRIVSGNTVIIEHAPGIYSIYYHLDKIEVQEDTMVKTGDLLALSGSTGFSTGPHLHWEIRVSSENTDPDIFLARPVLDKDLIISKISK